MQQREDKLNFFVLFTSLPIYLCTDKKKLNPNFFYLLEFKAFYQLIFDNEPTLAEKMVMEHQQEEQDQIEKAEWENQQAIFPLPQPTSNVDFKQ